MAWDHCLGMLSVQGKGSLRREYISLEMAGVTRILNVILHVWAVIMEMKVRVSFKKISSTVHL